MTASIFLFLCSWAVAFMALGVPVLVGTWMNHKFGVNFGLETWEKELMVVLVISLIQAAILTGTYYWLGTILQQTGGRIGVLVFLPVWVGYRLAHPNNKGISIGGFILILLQLFVFAIGMILFYFWVGSRS